MNRTRTSKNAKRLLVWLLLLTMVFGLLPMAAFADDAGEPALEVTEPTPKPEPTPEPETTPEPEQPGDADVTIEGDEEQPEDELDTAALVDYSDYQYSIVMVDCGRKYYSVESINSIISSAASAGMHYVMLAVGNEGLRFLLDDMSLSFNGTGYTSEQVKKAIHAGNQFYDLKALGGYSITGTEELTEADMVDIMKHAYSVGVQIIPLINTPGHMDAILYSMGSGTDALNAVTNPAAYVGGTSTTTIDVDNTQAVAFTQALLQKYITFFANKGCKLFNMGADEYANDIDGNPKFGNINTNTYNNYINHINAVAAMIEKAGMKPIAFNDGIYYNENSNCNKIDIDILVCFWSHGWTGGYFPASASFLVDKGFKLINTNGAYYYVLGKEKCGADKAKEFSITTFPNRNNGSEEISKVASAMFCIWSD